MSKVKIGITGVGGGAGQSIIKALQNSDYELIGMDGEVLGTGLYVTPKSYIIPYANSTEFIPTLLSICERDEIKVLFPGLDAELAPLAKARDQFENAGTKVIVSDLPVVEISDDKLKTFEVLTNLGFSVPNTVTLSDFVKSSKNFLYPIIVKQQVGGARSKNVYFFKQQAQFDSFLKTLSSFDGFIVQEYIDGDEYTCGSVNLAGECKGVIVMRRILRDGDTYKCFTERNEVIEKTVLDLVNAIKPNGACNVQLRIKNGLPYIFEINARCSGTTAARALSGFNEPKAIVDYLIKGIEPVFMIKPQTILRYWKEIVVTNESVEQVRMTGMHLSHQQLL